MDFLEHRFRRWRLFQVTRYIKDYSTWVANRQSHRRLQSEPPQNGSRRQESGSLPAANRNGNLVVQDCGPYGITSTNDKGNRNIHPSHARRLQSLPARKPGGITNDADGRSRAIKSAPDNNPPTYYARSNHLPNHGTGTHNPSNQLTNTRSRIADHDVGTAELHQKTHGIATRAYEENYLRSNKFATSWARVRADNPTFMENVPGHMVSEKRGDDSPSPSRSPYHQSLRETSPNRVDLSPYEVRKKDNLHTRGRQPFRRRVVKKQKHSRSKSPQASHTVSQKENQPPARDTDEESGSDEDDTNVNEDSDGALNDFDEYRVGKKSPRRQPWNDSVVVPTSNKPPPKLDARRCKHDLTFKPAVNTDHIVTKTYSGQDEIVINDRVTFDDNMALTDDEDGYASPSNDSSPRSNENSLDRVGGKERMLSRREAKMYIKMMNVYGSDAFKRQRKEWFVNKFNEVQEAKSKFEEQERKNLQKKRNEDKLKQERQLNYVRSKFRREQLHRFQTQYVTARVLEYEKATRHQYGLPEDFEDLAFLLKDDDDVDKNAIENADGAKRENNMKGNSNKNRQQPYMKNQKNQLPLNKKQKSEKQLTQKEREEEERRKEQERKARQKQSAWYTHGDAGDVQSNRQESPTSYGTSGYESEKSPSEHNGNLIQEPVQETRIIDSQVKQKADDKRKVGRQDKPSEGQNRLASQKNIYEQKPQQRVPQRPTMISDNAESKANRRKRKDDKGKNKLSGIQTSDGANDAEVKVTKEDEHGIDSRTKPEQQEKDKSKDIAHNVSRIPEKSDVKNKPLKKFPSKPDNEQTKDTILPISRNQLPSQGDGNSNKTASQVGDTAPSKDDGLQVTKSKEGSDLSRPHQTKPQKVNANNDNFRTKQPSKDKQPSSGKDEIRVLKADQNSPLPSKTPQDTNSSSTNKASTGHTSGPAKPIVEDDAPINIKRVPLAGTISKENAPHTFGVTENKLEDMLSGQKTQQPNIGQSSSASTKSTKEPPRDAPSVKTGTPKEVSKGNTGQVKPAVVVKVEEPSTNVDRTKGQSAKSNTSNSTKRAKPKKSETMANKMFNIKTGPAWNPHAKAPKMEGIDTVVITGKDNKGRPVRKKREVDSVVREASNLLKATDKDAQQTGTNSKFRVSRAPSPAAVTLGSDFDVDDDDELEPDIFERLRRKYNIRIDSDDEDDELR